MYPTCIKRSQHVQALLNSFPKSGRATIFLAVPSKSILGVEPLKLPPLIYEYRMGPPR